MARARWLPPMLATLVDAPAWLAQPRQGWVYERKLDGLRCLAVRNGATVELWSRNHNSFLDRFPEVATAVGTLAPDSFTLDGELVAHDGSDFVGFGQLQQHQASHRVVYGVFDLLHLLGEDTTSLAQTDRRRLLTQVVTDGPVLRPVDELPGDPGDLLASACSQGWEGLVAKRTAAPYTAGRSGKWAKLKCSASQELVIGGWTEPQGSRAHIGAVLVGYHEDGALHYAGKVGSGFTTETLARLAGALAPLQRADSPFAERVREPRVHWVEPRLVANVAFSEWTRDGRLRHPRFEGLRPDKDPATVVRERPAPGQGFPGEL
ncbi:MAG TPA: non-homologous end-joining DNA ligase [Acidimicrobiales bacterium]|nr:non-homologous end-joining DNA ligase [Acidimicrobiales bacterium]